MSRNLKILLNALVFFLIVGFGYYIVSSLNSDKKTTRSGEEHTEFILISPYVEINSFEIGSEIVNFDVYNGAIYAVSADRLSVIYGLDSEISYGVVYDLSDGHHVRDITVDDDLIYLLYPTRIDVYNLKMEKIGGWRACSDNADYCAITTSKNYVFVTDVTDKSITQYGKDGRLVRFIRSPDGFIMPSYAFDIININDTIYTSNAGRHRIESYTLNGEFITSFGRSGAGAGAFAGCCNPVYLAATSAGHILTSEKGNPRISSYGKDGKFRMILFDKPMLGGGTEAYRMRVSGEVIYIASRRTISAYVFDSTLLSSDKSCNKSCGGCKNACSK